MSSWSSWLIQGGGGGGGGGGPISQAIRDLLDDIERRIPKGSRVWSLNFGRNLCETFTKVILGTASAGLVATIMGFAERILSAPLEIVEGVPGTLTYLAARHELTLFTKGMAKSRPLVGEVWVGRHFTPAIVKRGVAAPTKIEWGRGLVRIDLDYRKQSEVLT